LQSPDIKTPQFAVTRHKDTSICSHQT